MIRPKGAWSQQVASRYVEQIDKYLEEWQADFASLVDLRQWELGTPEALKIISENDIRAISLGYKLEFHYGNPLALPMQISKKNITPEGLNMIQTTDLKVVKQECSKAGYSYDEQVLIDFLQI